MATNILFDVSIRNAKPIDKDQRLNDGGGLYLLIKPSGAKWWRFDYTMVGRRKTLSLGVYPKTSLNDARKKATAIANKVSNGIDPSAERKAKKIEQVKQKENDRLIDLGLPVLNSFEYVAREWGIKKVNDWDDKNNRSKRMLERNIFPWLGSKPITDILPKDILVCLRRIEDRGTIETAHRTLPLFSQTILHLPACLG